MAITAAQFIEKMEDANVLLQELKHQLGTVAIKQATADQLSAIECQLEDYRDYASQMKDELLALAQQRG